MSEPFSDLYVDGDKLTFTWDDGGKKVKVHLKPGTHKVEVRKDGFTAHGEDVTLEGGSSFRMRVRLEPPPIKEGILVIEVNEPFPELYVDGDKPNFTWGQEAKKAEVRLKPGNHKVEVKKDGFEVYREDVTVAEGRQVSRSVRLVKTPPPLDPERLAAEWVLLQGGTVGIRVEEKDKQLGPEKQVGSVNQLPAQPFALTFVRLRDKPIGDPGLARLKGLPNLIETELSNCAVSDLGLAHLESNSKLERLGLWGNAKVTNAGLAHLKGLTNLIAISLGDTALSDDGLAHLQSLIKLESLGLLNDAVTDTGLLYLRNLPNLSHLNLRNTKVSDAGVKCLLGFKKLRNLYLTGTKLSAQGFATLQKGLRNAELGWSVTAATADVSAGPIEGLVPVYKVYLSDLKEQGAQVGGKFTKHGRTPTGSIVVDGKHYPEGLFTPPRDGLAFVNYTLDGLDAITFETQVAVNDSSQGNVTPITFLVLGDDGELLWKSKPVKGVRQIETCKVRIDGKHHLQLQVHCTEPGSNAHAVWLDPYILSTKVEKGGEGRKPPKSKVKYYLADLNELDAQCHGGLRTSVDAPPLETTVNKEKFSKGLLTYPPSKGYSFVKYSLEGLNAITCKVKVAINDHANYGKGSFYPVTFKVLGDGVVLWTSRPMRDCYQTQEYSVPVEKVHLLELQVHCPEMNRSACAVWIDPFLICNGKPTRVRPVVIPKMGFVPLFNGKDLTGWKTHPSQPGNWRVKDGILIGSGPTTSHLFSERGDYKNFYLRAVARINNGGNSGVFFRVLFGGFIHGRFPRGYEAQINSTHADPNKTGSLYVMDVAPVSVRQSPVPHGEWFTLDVIAKGNHIIIQVNGRTTADYRDSKRLFSSGHVALQQHDPQTICEFRKIEINALPD